MTAAVGEHFVDAMDVIAHASHVAKGVPEDCVVVGLSAAAIWGMPLPPSVAQVIDASPVSFSRQGSPTASRRFGVDGHSINIPADHCVRHHDLRVTTPARTWVDCAALLPPDHLLALGDWALDQTLLTLEETQAIVRWARGRRGVIRAREVLPWLRTGVESGQESRLRWFIVADDLPEPEINAEIALPSRRTVRLDLAYQGLRLAVEFDGQWHHATRAHDAERRAELAAAGWSVIVATKDDLLEPTAVLRQIRTTISERTLMNRRRW